VGFITGQMVVADVAVLSQLLEGGLVGHDVLEQADLPELLAEHVRQLQPQQPAHERVGVDDRPVTRIEN
jgi:hypothetical protein